MGLPASERAGRGPRHPERGLRHAERRLRRAGRRTNVALLVLLVLAFGTGWLGYGAGTAPWSQVLAVVHALAGLGLLVLAPWKAFVVGRAWRRRARTFAGAGLVVLLVTSVLAGIVHSATGWAATGGLALQIHVGTAVIAVGFVMVHIGRHPQRVRRVDLSRRNTVRMLGVAGGAAVAYAATHGAVSALALPGGPARATGSTEVGSGDPASMPVTQWFVDPVPRLPSDEWRLDLHWPGGSRRLGYPDLLTLADDELDAVLDCTGGWYAEQRWRGVRLDRLLPAGAGGRSIVAESATGYLRRFPRTDARSLLLATHAGGLPLSAGHGAPARLVAPGRRGFWWVKWVVRIEIDDAPWWWQPPLPLR